MKIYAYVKSQTCVVRGAVRPGSFIGRNMGPVSRDDDYVPWFYGKRETLAIIARGCSDASRYYRFQSARLVAELLGWSLPTS